MKIILAVLAAACAVLAIALFATNEKHMAQHAKDASSIVEYSNREANATLKITQISDDNLALKAAVESSQQQMAQLSNTLTTTTAVLTETKASLAGAQSQIAGLNTQVAGLNAHVTDLEQQNKALDQRSAELAETIARLNAQIAETRAQLAKSETNNAFLEAELRKQMAEKAELEHKFNDLEALRLQVKKIKSDLYTARRARLMQNDSLDKRGAEMLMNRQPETRRAPVGNYDLNVEIHSDGSVKVIPPIGATNAPAR